LPTVKGKTTNECQMIMWANAKAAALHGLYHDVAVMLISTCQLHADRHIPRRTAGARLFPLPLAAVLPVKTGLERRAAAVAAVRSTAAPVGVQVKEIQLLRS
jgi:hypothetical protein